MEDESFGSVPLVTAKQEHVGNREQGSCYNRFTPRMHEGKACREYEPGAYRQLRADTKQVLSGIGLHDDVCRQQAKPESQHFRQKETASR